MLNKIIAFTLLAVLAISSVDAQVTYIHEDFQGSVAAESNAAGQITNRVHYEPYGDQRGSTLDNEASHTGHIYDADTGLSYMGSRYYDPTIGRFYSDDPVVFFSTSTASFNRYAYANNNPFAYTDPNGEIPVLVVWGVVALLNAASIYSEVQYDKANPCGDCVRSSAGIDVGLSSMTVQATKAVVKQASYRFSTVSIKTPWGVANQSIDALALAAREQVENGATLYRIGTAGKSEAAEAQFWSLESPLSKGFAKKYGIPEENIKNANFIETATLKPNTPFVTRQAPGIGQNTGGGIEVVVPKNGVNMKAFNFGKAAND